MLDRRAGRRWISSPNAPSLSATRPHLKISPTASCGSPATRAATSPVPNSSSTAAGRSADGRREWEAGYTAGKQMGGRHEPYLWCCLPERIYRAGYPRRHGSLGQRDGRRALVLYRSGQDRLLSPPRPGLRHGDERGTRQFRRSADRADPAAQRCALDVQGVSRLRPRRLAAYVVLDPRLSGPLRPRAVAWL